MFLKFVFKNALTLALAVCTILAAANSVVAQTSVSHPQIRDLPTINAGVHQATSKATRLFTINEKKSLPPVSQFNKARIVSGKESTPPPPPTVQSLSIPATQALPVSTAPTITRMVMPQSVETGNASLTSERYSTGYYTVSFGKTYNQSDTDATEAGVDAELDSPALGNSEADDPEMGDVDDDLEASDEDALDMSDDELDLSDDELDDEEIDDEDFDEDEDDSPIARPEFGVWPRKSIRQVRWDLAERGAESPEDRSRALFESSRRIDGNVAATEKVFAWAAPNIKYQPLYFEDVALERYGQTKGLIKQPFVSAGRFLADKVLLGTRAARVCPQSCDSPLGYCRPGSPSTVNNGCGCDCQNSPRGTCPSCH